MDRNYNVYVECPKQAVEFSENSQLFMIDDGNTVYSYPYYMDNPVWTYDDSNMMRESCNEFVNGYREMTGSQGEKATVSCQIVSDIPDSKFVPPVPISQMEKDYGFF
jgi:hypothetical protein